MHVSLLKITWLPGIVIMRREVPGKARQWAEESLSAFTRLALPGVAADITELCPWASQK